jgi:hypothetical protein
MRRPEALAEAAENAIPSPSGREHAPGETARTSALPPKEEESQWCQVLRFSPKNGPEHLQQAEAERNLAITLGASRVRMAIIEERALLARKLDPSK